MHNATHQELRSKTVTDDLVEHLSSGRHPLVAARAGSSADLHESIERGFVLLKFIDTQGGTELAVEVDKERSVLGSADFVKGQGVIQLVGRLTLNDESVELRADVDLATLKGEGNLAF
jgi:hypothetical protein